MTYSPTLALTLIKAAQHKYTHKKRVGTDKKGRARYRYYYQRHHGGGITGAKFEEGSAFKLTWKGRRGHFHIKSIEGDMVKISHDARPDVEIPPIHKDELRAILEKQHGAAETKSREKAQRKRKRSAKKKTAKREKAPKTQAPKKTLKAYITEQDGKISALRAQIGKLEQEEETNPRVDNFDEIFKLKEEIKGQQRAREIAQRIDEDSRPDIHLKTLKDPRDRTKAIIPTEAYNEIIKILEDSVRTQAPEPKTQERPPIERMSAAERKALDNDLAKALRDNDPETAHELIKKDQIDYAQSGDTATDEIFKELISAGEVETFDDGTKNITSQGRLSADQLKALESAAQEGLIDGRESGELKVYSLSSSADRDRSLSMLVRADGRAQLKIDDFRPPNDRDQRAIPEGEDLKPPVAKSKLDEHLQAIRDLIKDNPALANDPKVIALLGSQTQPKREGRTDEMFLTIDGKERKAEFRYQLIEAGDAIPSHDPVSFSKREDYPEGIQERIYHQDRMEQLKVQRNAGSAYEPSYLINTNPDATNGPPIVTPDGIVLGGNSRVMSTQLVNMRNPEGAKRYKEKLSQDAAIYGFTQEDIDAMSSPMLVRVYEPEQADRAHMAKLVRAMNENKTQGMDERTAGRAAAAKVSQETLKTLQRGLDRFPDFTFNRFLTRPSDALGTFKEALFKDGVLNAQNASELIRPADGTFTATGREFLQSMLTGYVVNDDRLLPNLDYATMEQLTVSLGKLAAAGITEKDRASLQNAIAIYDHGIKRNLVKQKGKPKDRNRAMDVIMLEEQELSFAAAGAEGSEADELSVSKIPIGEIKERVRQDPLASAFLKILVLNPGTKKLEDTMKKFVKLTEDTGQAGLFGGDETLDYTEAANKLAGELAKEHEIESRLYELPEQAKKSSPLLDLYKAIRC